MAERESSLVEARYGVAQEVAQRLELGRWTHGRTSCDGTSSRESLAARLREILVKHRIDYDLEWTAHGDSFLTRQGELVDVATSAIREQTGITPKISCTGGTSDGRFIARICRQIVEIGPINETIHKLNERVAVADLDRLVGIYGGILERLLLAPTHAPR
ncbi:MAG TPA: M20/M25/M40 family metallo-hydrolase [Casimicrobiaceae bacterium]|nr:M20/M25/M40 family metallo-hydrolase [Casimicrobiaceae bacterium]